MTREQGVHLISNADHVNGANDTRWVGRVGIEWRYRWESLIP
jgi:hypothetical protein